MQKKLIALAVAGLVSAPAFAQSNVTIYGIADAYVGFGKQGGYDLTGVQSGGLSGSRLGFRGTEDLGNGLKAVFVLEQGFNIDTGTDMAAGNSFARQAFVGLGGAFGTVALGRQYAPGYDQTYDALVSSGISPHAVLTADAGTTIAPNSNARWSNSVSYKGSFSGVTVRGIYSMDAVEGVATVADPSDDDAYGLGLEYANGPLKVGAVYQMVQLDKVAGQGADQEEWMIGGSYDFGVVKLDASYQEAEGLGNAKGSANEADLWQVGLTVPVSAAGNVHLAYGELDYDKNGGKAKSAGLAYTHGLSKRTTAYTGYNYVDNGKHTNAGIGNGQLNNVGGPAHEGKESHLFVVGVRHAF